VTLINANFADPNEITTFGDVVGQCILSDVTERGLKTAKDSVYGRALDLTRVCLGVFLELFNEGEVEAEGAGAWWLRAGESVRREFEAAIQHYVGTGSPEKDLRLARRYQNDLVKACNEGMVMEEDGADEPFHILLQTSPEGGYTLGGGSKINSAIKELNDAREARKQAATSKAMATDGQSPQGVGIPGEQVETSGVLGVVESIKDEELRDALTSFVDLFVAYAEATPEDKHDQLIEKLDLMQVQVNNWFTKSMHVMLGKVKDAVANDAA